MIGRACATKYSAFGTTGYRLASAISAPASFRPLRLPSSTSRTYNPSPIRLYSAGSRILSSPPSPKRTNGVAPPTPSHVPATASSEEPPLRKLTIPPLIPHENIYTIPNILTASRLAASPLIGYLILHDSHAWAFGLLVYAGLTDLVDGYLARKYNQQTVVGTVIDPMADKALMTILTVCLAIKGLLPVWLAVIILGRDAGLGISAIYYRWISLPPPKTFSRYWDFSLPSAEVHPTTISKVNTALQLALITACTAQPILPIDIGTALSLAQYVVASTTVWSGLSYIYSKDAVKILTQQDHEKK